MATQSSLDGAPPEIRRSTAPSARSKCTGVQKEEGALVAPARLTRVRSTSPSA
jgi:hypothetical protein